MKYLLRGVVALALVNEGLRGIANAPERFSEPWQVWVLVLCAAATFPVAVWVIFRGVE